MDALLHNPIADMYGPDFLLFYSFVIGVTIVICRELIQDPTKNQPLPLISEKPDPYEIAYLRSQEAGVAHVALFDLVVEDYLQVSKQSIIKAENPPQTFDLHPIEQQVFDKFSSASTVEDSIKLATQSVKPFCDVYEEQLQNEQLLYDSKWHEWNIKVGLIGAMIILSLGGYKLLIALGKGRHNVGFLITMGVLSIIYVLWVVSRRSHLSHRGKRYLQQLQETFAQLKTKVRFDNLSVYDYNLVVAIFGVEALAGTSYDSYHKAFFPPTYYSRTTSTYTSSSSSSCSSSSGCGSSCSSSSSSGGGGCGSSCGGGCGGGCGGCGG